MAYANMPTEARASVEMTKTSEYSEKVVATKNKATTSQIVQKRFLNMPYAAMMLVMPIKPMCGGKPLIASSTRNIIPTMP